MDNLQLNISCEALKLIQERLQSCGFYSGEINGVFEQATEEAVKAFQEEEGLVADGSLGLTTQEALDIDLNI